MNDQVAEEAIPLVRIVVKRVRETGRREDRQKAADSEGRRSRC